MKADIRDVGLILGSGREEDPLEESMAIPPVFLPGESHGQIAWRAIVHGVTQSQEMTEAT